MDARAWLWVAMARDGAMAAVDATGVVVFAGDVAEAVLCPELAKRRCVLYQPEAVRLALSVLIDAELSPSVAVRSSTGIAELSSVKLAGATEWQVGLGLLSDELPQVAEWLGVDVPEPEPEAYAVVDCARRWSAIGSAWCEELARVAGCEVRSSIASTASHAAMPARWRKASETLSRTDRWGMIRQAYHGGRVELYVPKGWTGRAVEYDIRSAYGWALTQWLPDTQSYEQRRPLKHEPGWYDATVRVSGVHAGPLPVRVDDCSRGRGRHRLDWPREGVFRGVWTREDIEREGVEVLEVHRSVAGRWSDDLRRPVERWLELRERTRSPVRRSMLRGLSNGLAGKLAQRPLGWELWVPRGEDPYPPDGAIPLGLDCPAFVVPVVPKRLPVQCPQAAGYITALVRSRVWSRLREGNVLYTDTDSLHVLESAAPPVPVGDRPGDWTVKHAGDAEYKGIRNYTLDSKVIRSGWRETIPA